MESGQGTRDPVLAPMIERARSDPDTIGLVLHGSRAAGTEDEVSDYDLLWILSDQAYDRRAAAGDVDGEITYRDGRKYVELAYSCPRRLLDPALPKWFIQGLSTAEILVDKSGQVDRVLGTLLKIPDERARDQSTQLFDGYLNSFYRSMKAARRGNELGMRLEAAESLTYLVRALFSVERLWPPFHSRLAGALTELELQDWKPGELEFSFLAILRTADPRVQLALEERVEQLMREHGHGGVIDGWDGELDRVKAPWKN
jgi:hypothetical protein